MTVRDVRFDAQLLTDLRQYRLHYHRDRYVLTADELDALLAVADERDALRRAACEMPDEVAPPPEPRARLLEAVRASAVQPEAMPLASATLPFCDCGSVDKYGDDLGEHGERCPYHLAVLRLSPMMTPEAMNALCARTLRAMANA